MHNTCETLATTSLTRSMRSIPYVNAFNREGGDIATTEGPAVDALEQSADAVESSVEDIVPEDLKDAFAAWVDNAHTTADAITSHAPHGNSTK